MQWLACIIQSTVHCGHLCNAATTSLMQPHTPVPKIGPCNAATSLMQPFSLVPEVAALDTFKIAGYAANDVS